MTKIASVNWHSNTIKKIRFWSPKIQHWKILCDDYQNSKIKDNATYFVDPPYNNDSGRRYLNNDINYFELSEFVENLKGQIIVCENENSWLSFKKMKTNKRKTVGKKIANQEYFAHIKNFLPAGAE